MSISFFFRRRLFSTSSSSSSSSFNNFFHIRTAHETASSSISVSSLTNTPASVPSVVDLSRLVKSPAQTFLRVLLPFATDVTLRQQFVNKWGMLRVGKLLEELDAFAGNVAYKFIEDENGVAAPIAIVTASFDRLDLLQRPLSAQVDLELRGMVTYAGTSSMNIDIDLVRADTGAPLIQAASTFVARDRKTNKAVAVPKLRPTSENESRLYEAGKIATESRKRARQASLLRHPPTPEELALVHSLVVEYQGFMREGAHGTGLQLSKNNAVFPEETQLSTTILTMPQHKNLHGKVFGGFLMRQAFEIAFATGWKLTGDLPRFLAMDDVTFLAPVETGALLTFDARCTYAQGPPSNVYSVSVAAKMSVPDRLSAALHHGSVDSKIMQQQMSLSPSSQQQQLTNTFNFVFYGDEANSVPRVYPKAYTDAMAYIEAHRRTLLSEQLASGRKEGNRTTRFPL
jgi:acyl-coenzyme A thioesterase 9